MEQRLDQRPADFRKRVAVKDRKRCAAVAGLQEAERRTKRQFASSDFLPLCCERSVNFRASSMLRSASRAESAVDRGDRCPVPVFEKVGSALQRC